jgi:hypothetical protein
MQCSPSQMILNPENGWSVLDKILDNVHLPVQTSNVQRCSSKDILGRDTDTLRFHKVLDDLKMTLLG